VYIDEILMNELNKFIKVKRRVRNKGRVIYIYVYIYINENCTILGYYVASSGNSLPMFRDNLWDSKILTRNYDEELSLLAA
jgi:hypothetical protein